MARNHEGLAGFQPVEFPSLDAYLWRPVLAGVWSHRDIKDRKFTFSDLLDIHEALDVQSENEYRAKKYLESLNPHGR